jgi:hypothetical protein
MRMSCTRVPESLDVCGTHNDNNTCVIMANIIVGIPNSTPSRCCYDDDRHARRAVSFCYAAETAAFHSGQLCNACQQPRLLQTTYSLRRQSFHPFHPVSRVPVGRPLLLLLCTAIAKCQMPSSQSSTLKATLACLSLTRARYRPVLSPLSRRGTPNTWTPKASESGLATSRESLSYLRSYDR